MGGAGSPAWLRSMPTSFGDESVHQKLRDLAITDCAFLSPCSLVGSAIEHEVFSEGVTLEHCHLGFLQVFHFLENLFVKGNILP